MRWRPLLFLLAYVNNDNHIESIYFHSNESTSPSARQPLNAWWIEKETENKSSVVVNYKRLILLFFFCTLLCDWSCRSCHISTHSPIPWPVCESLNVNPNNKKQTNTSFSVTSQQFLLPLWPSGTKPSLWPIETLLQAPSPSQALSPWQCFEWNLGQKIC